MSPRARRSTSTTSTPVYTPCPTADRSRCICGRAEIVSPETTSRYISVMLRFLDFATCMRSFSCLSKVSSSPFFSASISALDLRRYKQYCSGISSPPINHMINDKKTFVLPKALFLPHHYGGAFFIYCCFFLFGFSLCSEDISKACR